MSLEQAMPIPALKHHIVLVSAQALPTLLGASLPGKEPSHVHAVVTPAMREAARRLRNALEARGRQCILTQYSLEDSASQHALCAVLDGIREACGTETVGVNLTGGTKLMALAAAEWAFVNALPAFYIDTAGERVIHIGSAWRYALLPDVLTVRGLLAANGFAVEKADAESVPARRRDVLGRLLALACTKEGERALGRLNRLAGHAAKAEDLCARDDNTPTDAAWQELLSLCAEAGTAQSGNGHVAFPDEAARRWCNGGWFEEYVKMTLYRLKAERRIRDFASSVEVRREGVKNELDALFTARNRLFTIECKTAAMSGNMATQDKEPSDHLYKADSLHDHLGGAFAKAMLCSVRPLAAKDRERARGLDVRVVCGKELLALEKELITWSNEA